MAYFTHDNTEGYDDADLALLNRAWESLAVSTHDPSDIVVKSMQDHLGETLMERYNDGRRGDALVQNMIVR